MEVEPEKNKEKTSKITKEQAPKIVIVVITVIVLLGVVILTMIKKKKEEVEVI